MKTPNKITVNTLAEWSNLTPRRIRQLSEDGKLPKADGGELPMPDAVQRLFATYQGDLEATNKERLKLLQARTKLAEQRVKDAGPGDLLPVSVIERAGVMAAGLFESFGNRLYNETAMCSGGRLGLDPAAREAADRLGKEFLADFRNALHQWLARQTEQAAERGEAPAADTGQMMPTKDAQAAMHLVVNAVAGIPGKARTELSLTPVQVDGLEHIVNDVRREAASQIEAL